MRVLWGSYAFAANSCELASRSRVVLSDSGRPVRYVTRVNVSGWLEADGQAALSTLEASLRNALATPYQDLKFLTDDGRVTATSLLNASSLSGVRVVDGPTFDGTSGAEYATLRQFRFEAEAEYLVRSASAAVLSFQESVSVTGDGGPRLRLRVPVNASIIIPQVVTPRSVVRAVQSGQAVGHLGYPAAPPPLWPRPIYQGDQSDVQRQSPRRLGLAFVEYGIAWRYAFESDGPLVGAPNLPPL
jgi:hypothetical protein